MINGSSHEVYKNVCKKVRALIRKYFIDNEMHIFDDLKQKNLLKYVIK